MTQAAPLPPPMMAQPVMNPNGIYPNGQFASPVVTLPMSVPHVHDNYVQGPNPMLVAAHEVLAAAAAAAAGVQGGPPQGGSYAEVRGGVTYFNPNVQMPSAAVMHHQTQMQMQQMVASPVVAPGVAGVMQQQPAVVMKRPKAAIPIVDPNGGGGEGGLVKQGRMTTFA
jgi:hypothetical protein